MTHAVSPPPHEIVVIPPPDHKVRQHLLDQCHVVRTDVFIHEQQFPLEVETDEHDTTATHFLLWLCPSLTPIGTIRVYRAEGGYKFGRLAVLKAYRGYGFGRDLLLVLHQWVRDDAERSEASRPVRVVCHSQLPVNSFYAKYGYQPEVMFPGLHIVDRHSFDSIIRGMNFMK